MWGVFAEATRQQQSKEAELEQIKRTIKSFQQKFRADHGRTPTSSDLRKPEYSRQRVLVERYNLLRAGNSGGGLVIGAARAAQKHAIREQAGRSRFAVDAGSRPR